MKFSDMQLLRKMIDENVSQQKLLDYFVKQGCSEDEVLDELISYERELEQREALQTPTGKKLPLAEDLSKEKQITDKEKREMLDMWQHGDSRDTITVLFKMRGFPTNKITVALEDIILQPREPPRKKRKKKVKDEVIAPFTPKTEFITRDNDFVSKYGLLLFFSVLLIVSALAIVYLVSPESLSLNLTPTDIFRDTIVDDDDTAPSTRCDSTGVIIPLPLDIAQSVAEDNLTVYETNESCEVSFYEDNEVARLICSGSYIPGLNYTVNASLPFTFSCG